MNTNIKSTLALVLAAAALGLSLVNFFAKPKTALPYTAASFLKETAIELGVKEKKYEQCIADADVTAKVIADVQDTEAITHFTQAQGIGTPYNLIISDKQAIVVNGAYPYEAFEFIVNEINTNGVISNELLAEIQVTEVDYGITEVIRPFDTKTDRWKGSENPSITLIEYSDFECPFCSRVHKDLDKLVQNFDNVTWVYRHLPLSFHKQAMPAALASECVGQTVGNEAFWDFADIIFADQKKLQL